MQTGLFKRLLTALGNGFSDLAELFDDSNGNFAELAAYLGQPNLTLPPAYQALVTQAETLGTKVTALVNTPKPSYEQLGELAGAVVNLITAIEQAASPANSSANNSAGNNASLNIDWVAFSEQLAGTLVMAGLRRYLPAAYHWLAVVGVFTGIGNFYAVGDETYESRAFNLANFKALLSQPTTYLVEYFGWGVDFNFDSAFQADLMSLLEALGIEPTLINADVYSPPAYDGVTDPEGRGIIFLPFKGTIGDLLNKLLSVSLLAQSTYDSNVEMIEETDPVTGEVTTYPATGPYDEFILNLVSDGDRPTPLTIAPNLTLSYADFHDALRFQVGPNGINFVDGSGLDLPSLSIDPAAVLTYAPTDPLIVIGEPDKTRLQADALELALALSATRGVRLTLKAVNSQLFIKGSEGDSFFSSVLPDSTIVVPLSVTFSTLDGLRFNGANSLRLKSSPNRTLGPVTVKQVTLGLESTAEYDLALRAHTDLLVKLGPVTVAASELGVSFSIKHLNKPKDIRLGFNLPAGLGIEVESDTVSGGGYLFIDPAHHKYAGVATLQLKLGKSDINLNALGLLQTELPGKPNAYSLVLLITATFSPYQLGLGFTLNGLGGLTGINRSVDTDFLRGLVRTGGLDQLLFPANVLDNPMQALATVDKSFPATEDRYVFGIMAKISWGTPTLVSLDIALIIELPKPIRLVILGILRAILPDLDHPILRLRADFLGTIDFAFQRVSFDATLHDSGILMFNLSGDLAFRLYQGANPVFVLTAGGFHPYFQPPANANLPTLSRLTLSLVNNNDFRLILASYFAVTSNTVQFGSRLDLYVHLFSRATLEGYLYFDALFQFNPFYIDVRIEGGVAIKWAGDNVVSISLRLAVTGPRPWHVWGKAEFELFLLSYTHDIDETFGGDGGVTQPALVDVNVRSLLQNALADKRNWEMYLPGYREAAPVVLRPADDSPNLLVDPGGILTFTQRLVPLGYPLERYGNARPTQGNQFDIVSVTLGTGAPIAPAGSGPSGTGLVSTKDYFSPGQFREFREMNDGQKLSIPSFQLMNNGIRLFGPNGYASGPGAVRGVEYELIIVSAGGVGTAAIPQQAARPTDADTVSDDDSASRLALVNSDFTATAGTPRATITPDAYRRLVKNSAIGRAYAPKTQSLRAPDQFIWQEEEYAVVYAANLAPYAGASRHGSEAEATAFLREQYRNDPYLAYELLVVPAYQLSI